MRRGETIPSVAAGLALLAVASASAHAAGYSEFLDSVEFRGFRAEASYTSDDNVTRAPKGDALRDNILGVRVSACAWTRGSRGPRGSALILASQTLSSERREISSSAHRANSARLPTGLSRAPRKKSTSRPCATATATRSA